MMFSSALSAFAITAGDDGSAPARSMSATCAERARDRP